MSAERVFSNRIFSSLRAALNRVRGVRTDSERIQLDVSSINEAGLFDREWYIEKYPDVAASGIDPVEHYVRYGADEGRDPSDGFSTKFYLERHPDVVTSAINPLRHYIEYGLNEGRRPIPENMIGVDVDGVESKQSIQQDDVAFIAASGMFDCEYYLQTYPDVAKAGADPVRHYVRYGADEGRNPSEAFDTWFYLVHNPSVALGNVNPLRHYIERGRSEGLACVPEEKRKIIGGPLVSIIIPVYAVEQYLVECLESVASQTYQNLQIIVVDDGSPDNSFEIAKSYAKLDARFSVVRRANGGLGAARNTGVAEARGRYLAFVDSDDILPATAVSLMVSTLQRTRSDFVVGSIRRLKNGKLMPPDGWVRQVHAQDKMRIRLGDFPQILTDIFACNKLFDAAFFRNQVGRFPERIRYEDQEPTAKAYTRGVFDVLVDTVYYWRIREDGTSITQNKSNPSDLHDRLIVKQRVSRILIEEDESIYETWLAKAIGFDLRSYFEQIPRTDSHFFDRLREGMMLLADEISPKIWQRVRMIDRLPALAVLAGNRDDVITAVTRRAEYGYFVPGRISGGSAYLDRKYLEGMSTPLGDELLKYGDADLSVSACVNSMFWRNQRLHLEGYAYLTNLDFGNSFRITAKLVSDNRQPIEIDLHQLHSLRVDHESKDAWNEHARSGFVVEIDPVDLGLDRDSTWHIYLTVSCPELDKSYSVALRDVDPRSIPGESAVSAIREGVRWVAAFDSRLGFLLKSTQLHGVLVTAVEIENGEVVITTSQSKSGALLALCQTLRRRVESIASSVDSGRAIFRFALPDLGRSDRSEHIWHLYARGDDEPQTLIWAGDTDSLLIDTPEHGRIRGVMDEVGVLRLVQVSWRAVADEIYVEQGAIIARGRVDVVGASALSARLVGETQSLAADSVKYDEARQKFELSIPFDPALDATMGRVNSEGSEPTSTPCQPTMLHGFSLRLSASFQDQHQERWLRVAGGLQRDLPIDKSARRYGITFTRTQKDSALWIQFRPPYEDDERGILAQRRLHTEIFGSDFALSSDEQELEDAILFESFGGRQISDSVLAICKEVVDRRLGFDLYWTVADLTIAVPDGTTPLLVNSKKWMRQIRRSRYLVNNNNFPFYFRKNPGQLYLQTWHGTPLKKIGNHVPRANLSLPYRQLMARESKYWDLLLAQNDYAAKILPDAFDYSGKVLNSGYPRNDVLAGTKASSRRLSVRNKFGFEPYDFVVLYAPTWRDNLTGAKGYSSVNYLDFKRVSSLLGKNCKLIFRGHHNTAKNPAVYQANVIDFTHHPDVNDLLLAADLLITDYSSVMFDYVVTGKPLIFLTPDLDQYRDETRGLYFNLDEVSPGPVCHNNDELIEVISRLGDSIQGHSDRYQEFSRRFAPRDDGEAAKRVVDHVFYSN